MVHKVTKNENCYYCKRCGKASGDGDGLIGQKCFGKEVYELLSSNGREGGKSKSKKKLAAIKKNLEKALKARKHFTSYITPQQAKILQEGGSIVSFVSGGANKSREIKK